MSKPHVTIYTDGGCAPNPGPGGWAYILIAADGRRKEHSGNASDTTNNRMELTAAIEALQALKVPCEVTLHTDSQYLKNGVTRWLPSWVKRGWRTTSRQPVKNRDLWEQLQVEAQKHQIEWYWVEGHSGDEWNDQADRLATEARLALP